MTYAAPSFDFYDDGLVHAHEWSRAVPPGGNHAEVRGPMLTLRSRNDGEEQSSHISRAARQ